MQGIIFINQSLNAIQIAPTLFIDAFQSMQFAQNFI